MTYSQGFKDAIRLAAEVCKVTQSRWLSEYESGIQDAKNECYEAILALQPDETVSDDLAAKDAEIAELKRSADIAIDERIACGKKLAANDAQIAELKKANSTLSGNLICCTEPEGCHRECIKRYKQELSLAHQEIAGLKGDAEPVAVSTVEPLRGDEIESRYKITWTNGPVAGELYLHPPTEDKRDAERYRWLRDKNNINEQSEMMVMYDNGWEGTWVGEDLDAAIDAAMQGKDE